MRSLWLGPHLLDEAQGAAAHRAAQQLGDTTHELLLRHGDRLAGVSAVLAQQYYRQAAAAWALLGRDGFERWLRLGADLAEREPICREGAAAFFALPPRQLGSTPAATAASWCAIARDIASRSVKLASTFMKTSGDALAAPQGIAALRRWAEVGCELSHRHGWHGEFLAQAYFAAAPRALRVLRPEAYRLWAGAAAALYPAVKEREYFAALPAAWEDWPADDQAELLRIVIALAPAVPAAALEIYRDLPASLRGVAAPARGRLLRLLAQAGKHLGASIQELVPIAGALLQQLPEAHLDSALRHCEEVAQRAPAALVNALRSLPRLYEEAEPAQVRRWFAAGLAVADDNPLAGLAFFGLRSRTSLKVLRAGSTAAVLDESQGLLRKYIQMLSGAPAAIHAVDAFTLRPPLEEFPDEREVALPVRIDLLPTQEENLRLYRLIAAHLVGRRLFGTYELAPSDGGDHPNEPPGAALYRYLADEKRPELLADLFTLAEAVRVHHRLCAEFRGLRGEGEWVATHLLRRAAEQRAPARRQRLDLLLATCFLPVAPPRPAALARPRHRAKRSRRFSCRCAMRPRPRSTPCRSRSRWRCSSPTRRRRWAATTTSWTETSTTPSPAK